MRILSGIQPSGKLHLGNYFGAISQFLELQHRGECLFFIANQHALTTVHDASRVRALTLDVALDFLALGLHPDKATLFCQADVPEHVELLWYLSIVTPMGLLERAHSYKDKTARGIASDVGLFTYPILMAADILLYGPDFVPVGKDQGQHLEITRDIAIKFNSTFVPTYNPADPDGIEKGGAPGILRLPRALMRDDAAVVPGTDGEKMSKSYNNTLELFGDEAAIKKKIMGIKTDSAPVSAPKDASNSPVFALIKLLATPAEYEIIEASMSAGGEGYGYYKQRLYELFHECFGPARERRRELEGALDYVQDVLREGANRARSLAGSVMEEVRRAVGMR